MADVDKDTLKIVGHQFEDMINECTFKGINCRYGVDFLHVSANRYLTNLYQGG